jgi:hypothetical protein
MATTEKLRDRAAVRMSNSRVARAGSTAMEPTDDQREVLEFEHSVRAYPPTQARSYWRIRWLENHRRLDTTASTRAEAIAKATEIVERVGRGTDTALAGSTGADMVAHYLDPHRRPPRVAVWSENHRDEQVRYCHRFVLLVIATVPLPRARPIRLPAHPRSGPDRFGRPPVATLPERAHQRRPHRRSPAAPPGRHAGRSLVTTRRTAAEPRGRRPSHHPSRDPHDRSRAGAGPGVRGPDEGLVAGTGDPSRRLLGTALGRAHRPHRHPDRSRATTHHGGPPGHRDALHAQVVAPEGPPAASHHVPRDNARRC